VKRAGVVVLLVVATLVGSACAFTGVGVLSAGSVAADSAAHPKLRIDVAFVGDSNVVRAAGAVVSVLDSPHALSAHTRQYVPSFWARAGIPLAVGFWSERIGTKHFHPDVVVLNIGINDTTSPSGYADYGAKIDAFMRLIPKNVPVLWPGYPVAIEQPSRRTGALAVNHAWAMATARWPNLTIVPWGALADHHPEWINRTGPRSDWVHYTPTGYRALTNLEVAALNHLRV
jgi:hypothetical protein